VKFGAKRPENKKLHHSNSFAARAEKEKGRAQLEARSRVGGGWVDERAQKAARRNHDSRHANHGRKKANPYQHDSMGDKKMGSHANTACQNTELIKTRHVQLDALKGGETGVPPEFY